MQPKTKLMLRHMFRVATALAVLLPCALLSYGQDIGEPLAIIVNKGNPVENLSLGEVRRILTGERKYWKGSQKIVVLMPREGSPERQTTLALLHMSELDYKKHWLGKINAGEADSVPVALPASGTASALVSDMVAAVAIVPFSAVRASVKVVKVDNRAPSDSSYSLR